MEAAAILSHAADDYGAPGVDAEYGTGVLNMARALEHGTRGIYDVAVAPAYVYESGDEDTRYEVAVFAQNRGTEVADRMTLEVEIDGESHRFSFSDVGVGETVSHTFVMDRETLAGGAVNILTRARLVGVDDARPRDNAGRSVLQLAPVP